MIYNWPSVHRCQDFLLSRSFVNSMLYFQLISSFRWHALSNLGWITTDSISLRALFVEKIFTFSCVLCLAVIWLPVIGSSFPKRIPFVFPPFFVCVPPSLQSSNRHNESFLRFLNFFLVFQHEGGRAATEYWRRSWRIFFLLAGGKWIAMCAPMATYWKGTVHLKVRVHPFTVHHCIDGGAGDTRQSSQSHWSAGLWGSRTQCSHHRRRTLHVACTHTKT